MESRAHHSHHFQLEILSTPRRFRRRPGAARAHGGMVVVVGQRVAGASVGFVAGQPACVAISCAIPTRAAWPVRWHMPTEIQGTLRPPVPSPRGSKPRGRGWRNFGRAPQLRRWRLRRVLASPSFAAFLLLVLLTADYCIVRSAESELGCLSAYSPLAKEFWFGGVPES